MPNREACLRRLALYVPAATCIWALGASLIAPTQWTVLALSVSCGVALLIFRKVMQHPFSSGRNGRSIAAQADVPSAAKRVAFFT
jgi:hypothetical protein